MESGTSKKESFLKKDFYGINIHVIIGLALMFGIRFLPVPAPMSPVGLGLLGIFIGTIYLWATCSFAWPSILSLVAGSFYVNFIFPPAGPGIWKTAAESWGNWVVLYIFAILLILHALNQSGFPNRLALWFLTRRFAQKSPWAFTYVFLSVVLLFTLFIDVTPAQIFFFSLAYTMFEKLGYKQGDKYPMMILIGITFICCLGFGMTPIGHTLVIIGMGVFAGASHTSIGILQYMLVGIPTGLAAYFLLLLFFRYGVKPDMSNFQNINYSELLGKRAGPMDLREKIIVALFVITVIIWIAPGFVSLIGPGSALDNYLSDITGIVPALVCVVALMLIKVENKPLLDVQEGFKAMPWGVMLLITSAMFFGTVLTQDATGISAFIAAKITSILQTGTSTTLMAILMAIIIVSTNILNHVPVIIMFAALSIPLSQTLDMNPQALGTLSIMAGHFGFVFPAALAPIAYLYGNEWANPPKIMKYGAVMVAFTFAATLLVGYPIAIAIFK
jgi:sodium-dependent dicarboxylate transporter 2/3/5